MSSARSQRYARRRAYNGAEHHHPEKCPPREVQVCTHCFGFVEDFEPEILTGDELEWPCATVVAAAAGSQVDPTGCRLVDTAAERRSR